MPPQKLLPLSLVLLSLSLVLLSSIARAATLFSTPFGEALPELLITGTAPDKEATDKILPLASKLQLLSLGLPSLAAPVAVQKFPLLAPSYRAVTMTAPSFDETLPPLAGSLSIAGVQSVPEPSTGVMALCSVLLLWRRKILDPFLP
jgi:hypothetical protein